MEGLKAEVLTERDRHWPTTEASNRGGTLNCLPTPLARTEQKSACRGLGTAEVSLQELPGWVKGDLKIPERRLPGS